MHYKRTAYLSMAGLRYKQLWKSLEAGPGFYIIEPKNDITFFSAGCRPQHGKERVLKGAE